MFVLDDAEAGKPRLRGRKAWATWEEGGAWLAALATLSFEAARFFVPQNDVWRVLRTTLGRRLTLGRSDPPAGAIRMTNDGRRSSYAERGMRAGGWVNCVGGSAAYVRLLRR